MVIVVMQGCPYSPALPGVFGGEAWCTQLAFKWLRDRWEMFVPERDDANMANDPVLSAGGVGSYTVASVGLGVEAPIPHVTCFRSRGSAAGSARPLPETPIQPGGPLPCCSRNTQALRSEGPPFR